MCQQWPLGPWSNHSLLQNKLIEVEELDRKKQDGQFTVFLASIHNNDEKDFLKKLIDDKYHAAGQTEIFWTGGSRLKDGTKKNKRHRYLKLFLNIFKYILFRSWTDNTVETEECSAIDNFQEGENYRFEQGYAISLQGWNGNFFKPMPGRNRYKFICKIGMSI